MESGTEDERVSGELPNNLWDIQMIWYTAIKDMRNYLY